MQEKRFIKLEIPCTTEVKDYMDGHFGSEFKLSQKTPLEKCMIALLHHSPPIDAKLNRNHYSQSFCVLVPNHLAQKYGAKHLNDFAIRTINELIEQYLIEKPLQAVFNTVQRIKKQFINDNKNSPVNFKKVKRSALKISQNVYQVMPLENDILIDSKIRSCYRKKL